MSWLATAVIGGAVIGGVASNKASKRAAEGQENALASSGAAISQARGEVKDAFGAAQTLQNEGFQNALGTLFGGAERQIAPFQEGNVQAQNTLIGGLQQQQNALLGNAPVDLSGFQASKIPFQAITQATQDAGAGVLSNTGGQLFSGPLQNGQTGGAAITGSIVEAIRTGQLSFADMTPAQRQQWQQEVQQFRQGVGTQ